MNKIGIIVDGQGDFESLKTRFKKNFKIVKTDGPRGESAQPLDIITKSKKQLAILKAFNCKRVVLMVDFEERKTSYKRFLSSLSECIASQDFGIQFDIAVPNKMIENWYLADIAHLSKEKKYLKDKLKQKSFEGKHGKNEIKKCFKKNISYSETKHGPEFFKILRFDVAKSNSTSFKEFISLVA